MQIYLIVGVVTEGKKAVESTTENVEMEFMLDSKTMIAKSSTDADLNRVKLAITRNDSDMAPEGYKQRFNNLSMKWGLMFSDDKIIVPNELRKKLLKTLHIRNNKMAEKELSGCPISHKTSRKE